ncbi:hypothetical protein VOLCADRAFT_95120 [Volvox carteri f. nagariensis]|uniref:Protein kinase domain-containing protein n=1 Tax=Volvox carteri f. nagariensis TaxID=3068 RepID=D8U6N2_VOLCA|nr:uncharacterized protein VOLCADRAFT_95120 [Volvox carteri f. nagariensis]EFJ44676.1 hypothetical protein VOLCADRAFT_95120 [Volvox carteri f. nagariensis]|eukprot:XP_002954252.1 hypothetical protein VOLCADRAFT_95120 [Volvox carteri f. nagariensis]
MTASLEAQRGFNSVADGQIGIVTEDATVISITNFETAPSEATKEKVGTTKLSEDDSEDAVPASTRSDKGAAARRLESDDTSATEVPKQTLIPWKRGRGLPSIEQRCFFRVASYVWWALAVLIVFEVLAITGSILYARSVNRDARRAAADVARSSARAIETVLDHLIAPVMSLANLVHLQPHWPTVNESFPVFSDAIYKSNRYYQIELCPYGIVGAMAMPWMNATGNITAEEWPRILKTFDFGLDMLDPNRGSFKDEIAAILQNGSIALLGPWYADGELSSGAFVVRYSIFLPPGDWDMPPNSIQYCPQKVCNTPDGLTWWGWSNAVFAWKTVAPSLKVIENRNLLFTLSPDPRAPNQSFLAMSDKLPDPTECEVVRVDVYGWMYWTLCVQPDGGFGPAWREGLIVGVTSLSVVLAVLVGLVLRSRHQAVKYLAQQLETNRLLAVAKEEAEGGRRKLEAEKLVMDALLQRQRNLIELFGKEDELLSAVGEGDEAVLQRRLQLAGGGSQISNLSRESATVDRIEAVRRQLTGSRRLLSTMYIHAHTYTYFIKTVREEAMSDSETSQATDGILVGAGDNSTIGGEASPTGKTFDEPSQHNNSPAVHGYEVRLVLEFCDRGCLRDALDGDAFLTTTGVNYAGVLDTAADIAKAMLHLHLADVLHGDLKARNVMLKSSGTEGRGVVCKVADFGLAVKIDTVEQTHMSGMYQGTLTHMAPELLLHGRMSKAGDVYAFGVTLWELFTGGNPFQGIPRALLGHQIAQEHRRPAFPPFVPEAYVRLAEECWADRPEDRPTFEVILERLADMRGMIRDPAAPLASYNIGGPPAAPPPLPKLDTPQHAAHTSRLTYHTKRRKALYKSFSVHLYLYRRTAGSMGLGGGGSSGSSPINWAFAKSSHRTPATHTRATLSRIRTCRPHQQRIIKLLLLLPLVLVVLLNLVLLLLLLEGTWLRNRRTCMARPLAMLSPTWHHHHHHHHHRQP